MAVECALGSHQSSTDFMHNTFLHRCVAIEAEIRLRWSTHGSKNIPPLR